MSRHGQGRDEIEDGMGFSGLIPSKAERQAEKRRSSAWDQEAVLGVAMRHDATGLVLAMKKPKRHHDIIHAAVGLGVFPPVGNTGYTQGFWTVNGFYDRQRTAALIGHKGHLTSEDLW